MLKIDFSSLSAGIMTETVGGEGEGAADNLEELIAWWEINVPQARTIIEIGIENGLKESSSSTCLLLCDGGSLLLLLLLVESCGCWT